MKLPLAALFIAIFLPVQGQEKSTQPAANKHHTDDSKKPRPETLPATPPAQIDVINQQAPAKEADGTKNHPQTYLHRLFSPENLPSIGLLLAGVVGIFVAIRTLKAIEAQTTATRKAAEATEKSVELQKVGMDQWVDTDCWTIDESYIPQKTTETTLSISFTVVNPTKFKLILVSVELWIDREKRIETRHGRQFLAPGDDATMNNIFYPLHGVKFTTYRENGLSFEMGGRIRFVDTFNDPREQYFGFHCYCRPGAEPEFQSIAFSPPTEEEEEEYKSRRAQKPS